MEFKHIICIKCMNKRKVRVNSNQHMHLICGECWDWNNTNEVKK